MDYEIEAQMMKILNKISFAERTKNRALQRQTERLLRTISYMKAVFNPPVTVITKG